MTQEKPHCHPTPRLKSGSSALRLWYSVLRIKFRELGETLIRIYPPEIEIGDKEGFSSENDLFGRAELGAGMTNLVTAISDPLVIALDGKWGTGKTTFLKMWAGELRKLGVPVIYFDAFENDYADDAFAVLARELVALEEAAKPESGIAIADFKEKSVKLGAQLARVAAKVGTKAAIRVVTAGVLKGSDFREAIDEVIEETGDLTENYMRSFLSNPQKQKSVVEEFRQALEYLPALLAPPVGGEEQKPLVFIIDELDRCKPVFALEILERIKHFMSVPRVHFVLGVHLQQLKQSVQFAHGADIDATTYLQKFINLTIVSADSAKRDSQSQVSSYIHQLRTVLELPSECRHVDNILEFIQRVASKNEYSLRTLERIFTNVALVIAFSPMKLEEIEAIIAGLCILKVVEIDLFAKAKKGQLKYEEIAELFDFGSELPGASGNEHSWQRDWWGYALMDELPSGLQDIHDKCDSLGYRSRKYMVPKVANDIVDRLQPSK